MVPFSLLRGYGGVELDTRSGAIRCRRARPSDLLDVVATRLERGRLIRLNLMPAGIRKNNNCKLFERQNFFKKSSRLKPLVDTGVTAIN